MILFRAVRRKPKNGGKTLDELNALITSIQSSTLQLSETSKRIAAKTKVVGKLQDEKDKPDAPPENPSP